MSPAQGPTLRFTASDADNGERLDRALAALPLEYRLPLLLRYFSDASYDEIAEQLGTTRSNVGTLIFRAKRKLRAAIEEARAERSVRGAEDTQ